jgi:hypothetical protein
MTISFDPQSEKWKSRYSYDTSCFISSDSFLFTFNTSSDGEDIAYLHWQYSPINTFYGIRTDSQISLSFNANPSNNKVYKALSLEGSNLRFAQSQLTTNLSPDVDQPNQARVYEGFVEKGGIFYGGITKVRSTDNENGLKLVGEITRAAVLTQEGFTDQVPSINNGAFPFNEVQITDSWWEYIYFSLNPYPHYRALDSATSDDVISKYYMGVQVGGDVIVRPFRASAFIGVVGTDLLPTGELNTNSGTPITRSTTQFFTELSQEVYNTNTPPKLGNILAARVSESVLIQNSTGIPDDQAASVALAIGINNYLANGGDRLFLFKITDDRIDGSDPIGQYADLSLTLGSEDFELFAVNAEFSPTALDHSK